MARAVGLAIYNVLEDADLDIEKELQSEFIDYRLNSEETNFDTTWKARELELPGGEQQDPRARKFLEKFLSRRKDSVPI